MRKKAFRAVLWMGTMFVLLGIPTVNALADGPGQTPWDPPPKPAATIR